MLSTFETLPDEILMIILKYCGDAYTILKIFLGFNQRLNMILIDKRLHLLTDFLHINVRDDYYNSEVFQQLSKQLLSINTTVDEEKLSSILQTLLSFHIKQKYIQLGHEFQLYLENFKFIRQSLTNDEIIKIDHKLKIEFDSLYNDSIRIESIKLIKSFVLTKGACCTCDDYELCRFNLTKAVNELFLSHINDIQLKYSISINSFLQLFKILIISNTSLINNRDYVGNGGCNLEYFLIYTLYKLGHFYHGKSSIPINMKYYRATIDLFLFIIQCQKQIFENEYYIRESMFNILEMISKINNDIFIQVIQWEILKIVVHEYILKANELWNDYLICRFKQILKNLIENNRLDILIYLYRDIGFEQFFNIQNYTRQCLDLMTKTRMGRKFFYMIADEKLLELFFSKENLIFILLDKKERQLLEKLLKLSPYLIHQLDEDGNDPLLYICLKVSGCRHRIIEFLIKIGSNLQRINFKGQNFIDVLQLQRNQKLLKKLIEQDIITINI
ncbi:unnamed protein product [Rotaria sordida]|uniref:Uncharacterized protein n=1 Tax=Rotaria sordida TaxID=392033 RepID=A0A819ZQ78_9BILA|nr:unnamed protein product [Rotaria sordida]CAF4171857.1 unnamed protein product [Rotaria sordida]